jgi:hypothetical protein
MVSYRFSLEFSTVIYTAWDLMKIAPWNALEVCGFRYWLSLQPSGASFANLGGRIETVAAAH